MLRVRFLPNEDLPADHYEGVQQTLDGLRILLGKLLDPDPAKGGGVIGGLTGNGVVVPDTPASATSVVVQGPVNGWAMLTGSGDPGGEPFIHTEEETVVPVADLTGVAGGQSRNDLIVARINVGQAMVYGFESVIGTPAATGTQVDPALPPNSFALARITRASGAPTIDSGQITDLREELVL